MNEQRPTIREWPPEDRPRERFLTKGPDALSDAECLALLLGGGGPGQTVLDQAQALLAAFGSLAALVDREVQEIADCTRDIVPYLWAWLLLRVLKLRLRTLQ